MLFDYRFWLRRFLEWLLNDSEEDECEKLVTKGIIGEPYLFFCATAFYIKHFYIQILSMILNIHFSNKFCSFQYQ